MEKTKIWNDQKIESTLKEVMKKARITTFPSRTLMREITKSHALGVAVSRSGGTKRWAEKLGVETKTCESKLGYEYECECLSYLTSAFGYNCEFTMARYPYDILVNGNIKVDVKSSNLYRGPQGNFYTFNLEKEKPTCDIFVCYCIDDGKTEKVYVIPSCVLSGHTQLSIGQIKSKYDKYIDRWDVFPRYDDFYNKMLS